MSLSAVFFPTPLAIHQQAEALFKAQAHQIGLFQLLTESVVLSVVGGLAGLMVAYWSRDVLWSYRPPFLDADAVTLSLDSRVLLFTFGIALFTAEPPTEGSTGR